MSDSGFSRRKQQLLDKFLAGEIDKPTYDALLGDLQELGSAMVAPPPAVPAGSHQSVPSVSITESRSPAERIALSQPVALLEPGTKLGEFELKCRLSRGGMGEVWQAHDPTGERMVVIKVLPPELQRSADEMARVKQTFNRVHNLQHQHICPVYLLGQDPRFGYYIVMKYIDGPTLAAHRKSYVQQRGSFSLKEAVRVLAPIASALDYAHGRQIIHRDIKPQNVMLSADGQDVQLVDFGLSAEIRTSVMRISQVQMETCGTYPYMAPEQWRGQMQDARTDQYALGVVAFELLAGRLPFEANDPAVLRMCVLNDAPPAVEAIPPTVNAVIVRAMAKSRDDRFENCVAFVKAIVKAASDQPAKPTAEPAIKPVAEPPAKPAANQAAKPIDDEIPGLRLAPDVPLGATVKQQVAKPDKAAMDSPAAKPVATGASQLPAKPKTGMEPQPKKPGALSTGKSSTTKRPKYDELEDLDDLEIIDSDDAIVEDDDDDLPSRTASKSAPKSTPKPAAKSRAKTRPYGESNLKKANSRAMLWVGVIGGSICAVFVGIIIWLARPGANRTSPPTVPDSNSTPIVSNDRPPTGVSGYSGDNSKPKPAAVQPNAKAAAPLRYEWEQGKSYIYAVNLELEPEKDVVLAITGNSTYTRGQPVARKSDAPEGGKGTGTGFVVQADGYLMTCQHVVDGASEIEVAIGGQKYAGTVVTEDVEHDLALVQIEARGLPTLALFDSDKVQVGEEVRAIGFPFSSILGDNIKATRGTISGINQEEDRKVLQVDAGINPGNSGGPLVNERGEVVGVNFAKMREEVATNVGFAVPINDAVALLQAQGIQFTKGAGAGTKLDGPDLVKKVASATALFTVTTGGAAAGGLHHFELRCSGTFNSSVRTKAGQSLEGATAANLRRQHLHGRFGGGTSGPDVVETDPLGHVYEITGGRTSLPAFQGPLAFLVLEHLPSTRRPNWTHTFPVQVVYSEESGETMGMPHRFRPRFRPPGPFGGQQNTVKTTHVPGRIRISYSLQSAAGDLIKIKKEFDLEAREPDAREPRVQMKGSGVLQFNQKTGVPQSLEYTATLVETEPNKTTKLPIKLTYTLRGDQGDAAVAVQDAPAADAQPVRPADKDEPVAAVEGAQKLSKDDIRQCLDDLNGTHAGKISLAAGKLQKAVPLDEHRDQVLAALEKLLKSKDQFRRKQSIEAMATWATPETVPVLIQCLDESALLVKLAAIEALGKLKDERAAEPLAKLITEPGPRVQAAVALKSIGSKAESAVLQLMENPEAEVRAEACRLLKDMGTSASLDALRKAAQDSDRTVSKVAKEAIAAIAKRK